MNKQKIRLIIRRTVLTLVLLPLALLVLLPLSLYVPVVQDWVCQAVVSVLNETSDDLSYEVGAVRLGFPLRLKVLDVAVRNRADSTLVLRVGSVQTALDDLSIQQSHYAMNELHIADVEVGLDTLTQSLGVTGRFDGLDVHHIDLRLDSATVRVQQIVLDRPDLRVAMGPSEPDSTESQAWSVLLDRIVVRQGRVAFDMSDASLYDAQHPDSLSPYLDYQHLALTDIDLEAEDIAYDSQHIAAQVNLARAVERNSGLELSQLQAGVVMRGDRIIVDDLDLRLADADYLRGSALLDLTLADSVPRGQLDVKLTAAIDSANLTRLAAPYLPALQSGWVTDGQSRVELNARMTSDSIDLRRFKVKVSDEIDLVAEGVVANLLDNEQRRGNLRVKGKMWHADPLLTTFVAQPEERAFCLPDSVNIDLRASQYGKRLTANLDLLQRGLRVACAEAAYDVETEAYQVRATLSDLRPTDYVPALPADRMTAHLVADGRHFDLDRRATRLDASLQIDSLYYRAEDGRRDSVVGVMAEASLIDGNYSAVLASRHPTLRLDAQLDGCYRRDSLSAAGFFNVTHADLSRLPYIGLNPELGMLTVRSRFDMGYNWADNARLSMVFDTLSYDADELHQHFHNIVVGLDSRKDWLVADVTGGDALLGISTDRSVAQLPVMADSLLAELNRQLRTYRLDVAALIDRLPPRLDVQLRMARQNPFSQALEYQTGLSFDHLWLTLHNDPYLTLRGQLVNYLDAEGGTSLDTISVDLWPARMARTYDYQLHAQHHDLRETRSYDIKAAGRLMPDSLTVGLQYIDGRQKTVYDMLASLAMADDTLTLHLEEGPTLYEQPFTVNPDNYIRLMQYSDFDHAKPSTQARLLMDGPRDLKMQLYTRRMRDSEVGNQLLFLVRNLDLGYAHQLMEWDTDLEGRLNLTTSVDLFPDSVSARIRTGIRQLDMAGYLADTVALDMTAFAAPSRRDLQGTLALDSIVKVRLDATLADSTDIHADIDALPLPLIGAVLPANMLLRGTASGRFRLLGRDFDHATINGGLALADAGLTYTDLNARLSFPADTIRFARNRLLIHDYQIMAANKNPIILRGLVDMSKNMSDPAVSLTVRGENVRIINSKHLELKDQYICGCLPISPDIKVSGSLSNLNVTGRLSLLSGTDLKYYMQDDPLESSSRVDQLVEFVRFDHIDRMLSNNRRRRQQVQTATDEGMNVELKIDIDKAAKVTAILAGTDNNKVGIVGGAGMTLQCLPDGRMVMNGSYDINSGLVDYKLPILPMVKTFRISNNSNLLWQGSDPGNPAINITATEEVRATVSDDGGSRVVRFLVSINIAGTLDALNLTFDCSAPEDGAISSDIATLDADERSKAALMLLIAQTYIGPGNSSSMGLGTANAALNSMLNREMDSMLSGMKHTNIDLGIDTYNTDAGNTRTDYSVKVSQNFFNDRFRATIGGQVSSGGDAGQSSGARLGDLSLEWLIKRDGSHLMKLYRTTNYESVLEGELIETGISYVQERSAYRLRQLFIPTSRKRQELMQQHIRELQQQEEDEEMQQRRTRQAAPGRRDAQQADSLGAPTISTSIDSTAHDETRPE